MIGIRTGGLLIAAIALSLPSLAQSSKPIPSPKSEVRAVWMTTASGLDWPPSTNRTEQQASLRRIVLNLKSRGFNTIFFQVRARGDAYYRSRFEPWAENLTGVLGKDPGWDPLAFLLHEAHAQGMEVHAWINVFKVRGPNPVQPSTPEHPSRALAGWCIEQGGELWLDPGRPEVRRYLVEVVMDLVRSYDIDGINFDFVRYPGERFNDQESYARYGRGLALPEWRRRNITDFVREAHRQAMAVNPRVKFGASPLGVYRDDTNGRQRGSYYGVSQDSHGWLREGILDYVSPQIYWVINPWNGEPDFARVANRWRELAAGRHVYAGVAAYRPEIQRDLGAYIDTVRAANLQGHVFFRLESITPATMPGGGYHMAANIPSMTWKDSIPPNAVSDLSVTEIAHGTYRLQWAPPGVAADGDTARYYNVYRWTVPHIPMHIPEARLAITLPGELSYVDSTASEGRSRYFYAVTAFDRMHNESPPSPVVSTHSEPALATRPQSLPAPITLGVAIEHETGLPTLVHYTLPTKTRVALDIILRRAGIPDTLHAMLVRAVQDEGTYRVNINNIRLPAGSYILRLTTERNTVEQDLRVGP
ncbi:MAG: family 10 glycosylhydrolase [Bacteroidetes bacterium]|nr:family 10 glycosylhydrolase [Bacteroidota bacterium]